MSEVKIYEVPSYIRDAMNECVDEDGVLDSELYESMIELILGSETVEKKLDGIRYHLLCNKHKSEITEKEIEKLTSLRQVYSNQEKNLKQLVIDIMKIADIETIDTGIVRYNLIKPTQEKQYYDISMKTDDIVIQKEILDEARKEYKNSVEIFSEETGVSDVELYNKIVEIISISPTLNIMMNDLRDILQDLKYKRSLYKDEKARITHEDKLCNKQEEQIKIVISEILKTNKLEKLDTGVCKFGFRKSTAINVSDVNTLPEELVRVKPATYEPDKTAIKKALKNGAKLEGVDVVESKNLSIK